MTKAMKKQPFFLPFGGCRGRCVFCNQRAITGVDEVPSPQFVSSILKNLTEPVEVCYFGGSFCRFTFEKIKEYLVDSENTYYVVFWAGHMVCDTGIITQLEEEGIYEIVQVKQKFY